MSMMMLMLMQCLWLICKLTLGVLQAPRLRRAEPRPRDAVVRKPRPRRGNCVHAGRGDRDLLDPDMYLIAVATTPPSPSSPRSPCRALVRVVITASRSPSTTTGAPATHDAVRDLLGSGHGRPEARDAHALATGPS